MPSPVRLTADVNASPPIPIDVLIVAYTVFALESVKMAINLRGLVSKLNPTTRSALEAAAGLCVARTHYEIEIPHLLSKFLLEPESDFRKITNYFHLDNSRIERDVDLALDKLKSGNTKSPAFSLDLVDALTQAWLHTSLECNANEVRTGSVVAGMLNDERLAKSLLAVSNEFRKVQLGTREQFFEIVRGSKEDLSEPLPDAPSSAKRVPDKGLQIFLSYRHADGALYAEFLYGQIGIHVPNVRIFRDDDTLMPGILFADKITEAVKNCDVLIAIIGKKWLGKEGATRRIDSPDDWVRLEVATALKMEKLVIPCLIEGAKLPTAQELPADLAGLTARHTVTIGRNALRRDTESLINSLKHGKAPSSEQATQVNIQ